MRRLRIGMAQIDVTVGDFAVIKDIPKTLVYGLAQYRNSKDGREIIPRSIMDKAPSAELRPNQSKGHQ